MKPDDRGKTMNVRTRWLLPIFLALLTLCGQAFAQTTILATGQSAATSSDVTNISTGTITRYGETTPSQVKLTVYFVGASTEVKVADLTGTNPTYTMTTPGTYRVKRADISTSGVSLGAVADLGPTPASGAVPALGQATMANSLPVAIASNQSAVPVTQSGTFTVQPGNTANTTAWKVDGSAVTQPVSGTFWQVTQPVSGTVTANAGINLNTSALALEATQVTGNASLAAIATSVAGATPAGTNQIGHVVADAATTGGASTFHSVTLTNTATAVDALPGQLYGYIIYNPNATVCHVQLWDLATGSVTVGTTANKLDIPIPANGGANVSFPFGILFSTAITAAETTTDGGSTACGTLMTANFLYR
jgi:hypothetical protein